MAEIKTFAFNLSGVEDIRNYKFGSDWPIVYLIENGKELYVGETYRAYGRTKQHLEKDARNRLNKIHVISDEESNKSATLDTESSLIEYLVADGKYVLQNGNGGMQNHDYFDRERYQGKFELLWKQLQELNIAKNDLLQIRNSDLFKYSPYKTLTDDQFIIATTLLEHFKEDKKQTYIIHGGPGTGKTILATFLVKQLVEQGKKNVALVIAMVSLRKTLKKVFKSVPGLNSSMVIGPNEVVDKKYDILIVDETHRLHQRRNIPNYGAFDTTNRRLGLGNEGTELDWILQSANQVVLFYDERQSVRPSDISAQKVLESNPMSFELKTQMRVKGGENYLHFIDNLLENGQGTRADFLDYDFKVYDDLGLMVSDIQKQEKLHTLSRMVAGYAWKWVSKNDKSKPDIVVGDTKLFWNSKIHDWVNSPNAMNEVGCIHTVQGYDLNYVGVIIGPELSYDATNNKLVVNAEKYKDINGKRSITEPKELERYIVNIYKTLLTRGIKGAYVYVVDKKLEKYLIEKLNKQIPKKINLIRTPYTSKYEMINIPLFGSIGCGNLMYADPTVQEMIPVRKDYMSSGSKYFVLKASGDSMNKVGVNDGDLVLCQKNYHPEIGNKVVALIGDDATIKEYQREENYVILKPVSSNPAHKPMKFNEGDDIKVQGVVVRVLEKDE